MIHPYTLILDGRNWSHINRGSVDMSPAAARKRKSKLYILTDTPEMVHPEFKLETDGIIKDLDHLSDQEISDGAFYIYFRYADSTVPLLERIIDCKGLFFPPPFTDKKSFFGMSEHALNSYNEAFSIRGSELHGGLEVMEQICQAVELTKDVEGDFIELGVFSGSSALCALTHLRNLGLKRTCWLMDTFTGFSYDSAKDSSDASWFGTHAAPSEDEFSRISNLVSRTNQDVRITPIDISSDPLPKEITKVAIANLDVDMYEPTLEALNKLGPLMSKRGIIICEDPTSVPLLYGAYCAMKRFLKSPIGQEFISVKVGTQFYLIKT